LKEKTLWASTNRDQVKTAAFWFTNVTKNVRVELIVGSSKVLVIAPHVELGIQTQEELFRLSRDKKVRVQVVMVERILVAKSAR